MAKLSILVILVFLVLSPFALPAGGDLLEFQLQVLDIEGTFVLIETAEKNVLIIYDVYKSYSYIHSFLLYSGVKDIDLAVILGREEMDGQLIGALAKTLDIDLIWAMDHEVIWYPLTIQPLTTERRIPLDKNSSINVLFPPMLGGEMVEERGVVVLVDVGSIGILIAHNLSEVEHKVFFRLKPELKADVVIITSAVSNAVAHKLMVQLVPEVVVRSGEHVNEDKVYYPYEQGILQLQTDGLEVFLRRE